MTKKPSKWQLENPAVRFYAPKALVAELEDEAAAQSMSVPDYVRAILAARKLIAARKVQVLAAPNGVMCCFCHQIIPDHYIERVRAERDVPDSEEPGSEATERDEATEAYLANLQTQTDPRADLGQFATTSEPDDVLDEEDDFSDPQEDDALAGTTQQVNSGEYQAADSAADTAEQSEETENVGV
jgi:hypothetical protein